MRPWSNKSRPPAIFAVVEIWGGAAVAEQEAMLARACRMSRSGRVIAVLHGLDGEEADEMLQRVYASEGLIPGLLEFAGLVDVPALLRDVPTAPLVVALTSAFRRAVEASGMPVRRAVQPAGESNP